MKQYLLPKDGQFHKACLHVHTHLSDGSLTPEEVKAIYKANGYSIVAYTDHQIMLPHPELDDADFLTLTSCEVARNMGHYSYLPSTHINIYSKDPAKVVYPFFSESDIWLENSKAYVTDEMRKVDYRDWEYGVESLNKVIELCEKEGFLVCFNHPQGSLQNHRDYSGLRGLWGMECYNHGCYLGNYHESIEPIEDLQREGERKVYPIAADDAHGARTCCGGWVMVKTDELRYDKVMQALEAGDFYASTGPKFLELFIENGILHVETEDADELVVTTPIRFRKTIRDGLDAVDIDLTSFLETCRTRPETKNAYFRLTLRDKQGKVAYTRAFFVDEIG